MLSGNLPQGQAVSPEIGAAACTTDDMFHCDESLGPVLQAIAICNQEQAELQQAAEFGKWYQEMGVDIDDVSIALQCDASTLTDEERLSLPITREAWSNH
jgi:hypothetical protein